VTEVVGHPAHYKFAPLAATPMPEPEPVPETAESPSVFEPLPEFDPTVERESVPAPHLVESIPGTAALMATLPSAPSPDLAPDQSHSDAQKEAITADGPSEDTEAVAWTAGELPELQRDMLLSVWAGGGVVKNAATRIALINRKLLKNGEPGVDWWSVIEMTDKGRAVAEHLVKLAANSLRQRPQPLTHREFLSRTYLPSAPTVFGPLDLHALVEPLTGVELKPLAVEAHSDDHDPNIAAAYALRSELELAVLNLKDAITEFTRIKGIASLSALPTDQLDSTSSLISSLRKPLYDALHHIPDLVDKLAFMTFNGAPYPDTSGLYMPGAEPPPAGESSDQPDQAPETVAAEQENSI
jgi:hypothetical protein